MLSNLEIKRKEIYKANQKLLKVLGDFKKAQCDYLKATNQLALDELDKANSLVRGVHNLAFKTAVKKYMQVYGEKVGLERSISQLKAWECKD